MHQWRRPTSEDLCLGLLVKLTFMREGGCYEKATVISIEDPLVQSSVPLSIRSRYCNRTIRVARPMAWASEINSKSPMLYAEVLEFAEDSFLDSVQVWDERDGPAKLVR